MGEVEAGSLKRAAARGIAWKIAAEAVTQVTRLVLLLILARLLAPADFGLASIVLAFVMFVPVLSDLGLGASLIQRQSLSEVDRSTVFWTSVCLGLTFMLLGFAASWGLASVFHEPTLQPLFSLFSVSFLVASLSSVPNALLMRRMDFRSLELRVIAGTLLGAGTAITLAVMGYGPWAIVAGDLVGRVTSLVMLWLRCRWKPRFTFSTQSLRSLLGFGGVMLGAHLLMQFAQTIQNLMIGRLLGAQALGRLTVSQTLVLLPFNRIATPIQEVMFPTFSRMQDEPHRILGAWIKVNKVVMAIAFPTLAGLAILAPEFTQVVLSEKWHGTEDVIRALTLAGVSLALQRLAVGVLAAVGFARSLLLIGVASVVLTAAAILVGYRFGLTATAFAIAVETIVLQMWLMQIAARSVGARLGDVLRPLGRIALAACVMAAVVAGETALVRSAGVGSAGTLLCGIVTGALVFIPLLMRLEPALVGEVLRFLRSRTQTESRPGKAEPASAVTPKVGA